MLKTKTMPEKLAMFIACAWLLAGLGIGNSASAQQFPSRPIRFIVPLGAGGSTDVLARLLAPGVLEETGQPLVVENRAGAEGIVGTRTVVTAPPDGYTVLLGTNGTHVLYTHTPDAKAYDAVKDFVPVTSLMTIPILLWGNADLKAGGLAELIRRAKEAPGKITVGTSTNSQRLLTYMFSKSAGIQVTDIPFRSTTAAMVELAAGRIDVVFTDATGSSGMLERVQPLAVMADKRVGSMPDVPTAGEVGVNFSPVPVFIGLWAPAKTPPAVVSRLNEIFGNAMKTPRVREFLARNGAELFLGTPADFKKFQNAEIEKLDVILKSTGFELR